MDSQLTGGAPVGFETAKVCDRGGAVRTSMTTFKRTPYMAGWNFRTELDGWAGDSLEVAFG